ncbi:MAG: FAD:protein FMN transferase, partial [Gammaproteobacteria bacterium]|nr:FAD:protein FMN transferase [Gammaproteobacteria bacterium]
MLLLTLAAPTALADWFSDARAMMGTEVSVHLWSDDPEAGRLALEEVFQEAARIDRLMSTYRDESEISKINRDAAQGEVVAGDELFGLIRRSLDISVLTRGAFDITYDSVGQHYDFRSRQRPDVETVEVEREHIDYQLVKLDQVTSTVRFLEQGV